MRRIPLAKRGVIRVVVRRYCSDRRQPERDLAYLIKLILDWGWVHATQHLVVAVVHMFVVVLHEFLYGDFINSSHRVILSVTRIDRRAKRMASMVEILGCLPCNLKHQSLPRIRSPIIGVLK